MHNQIMYRTFLYMRRLLTVRRHCLSLRARVGDAPARSLLEEGDSNTMAGLDVQHPVLAAAQPHALGSGGTHSVSVFKVDTGHAIYALGSGRVN